MRRRRPWFGAATGATALGAGIQYHEIITNVHCLRATPRWSLAIGPESRPATGPGCRRGRTRRPGRTSVISASSGPRSNVPVVMTAGRGGLSWPDRGPGVGNGVSFHASEPPEPRPSPPRVLAGRRALSCLPRPPSWVFVRHVVFANRGPARALDADRWERGGLESAFPPEFLARTEDCGPRVCRLPGSPWVTCSDQDGGPDRDLPRERRGEGEGGGTRRARFAPAHPHRPINPPTPGTHGDPAPPYGQYQDGTASVHGTATVQAPAHTKVHGHLSFTSAGTLAPTPIGRQASALRVPGSSRVRARLRSMSPRFASPANESDGDNCPAKLYPAPSTRVGWPVTPPLFPSSLGAEGEGDEWLVICQRCQRRWGRVPGRGRRLGARHGYRHRLHVGRGRPVAVRSKG